MADSEFAARLRRLRLQQQWTQAELADLTLGICSRRTIQNWENGVNEPQVGRRLRVVAEIFRVSPHSLLTGEDD